MATKSEVLADAQVGVGVLGRAEEDEPVFVLRAHDADFCAVVKFWAAMRMDHVYWGDKPIEDMDEVKGAIEIALQGEAWRDEEQKRLAEPVAPPDVEVPQPAPEPAEPPDEQPITDDEIPF